ncbi:hypothetical protein ODZ84_07060 [Chryseobacterium fluminis]|uniref:hypothetical protein n=1 Tax=Chryseobacterium fluminis TaxID=2983606 RepID=UPI002257117E|nr:hypothetical protein [Chryseobacterium sp. MMS21-Ot14]UZT99324.1 hypothetical protein ODZ84_07060 [Chryseobacterium sp. MMS21-Ot14]
MARIFLFTDPNAMVAQSSAEAFGPLSGSLGTDQYNLENKFSVTDNAPVFAVCKSLLLAQEDPSNPELLNIALLPITVSALNNIPVKFFIYRGIKRNSLYGADGKILTVSNMRSGKNIIERIQQIQQKMNNEAGTTMAATKKYLGCEVSGNLYLEQAFFLESNTGSTPQDPNLFHPMIVDEGFEIGKFKGGTTKAGFQIILDRIGYEPKLNDLRRSNDILQAPSLSATPTGEERFKDRVRKEKILAYMDCCAFFGNFYSNKASKIGVYSSGEQNMEIKTVLSKFYNKNTIYIDIRDDYGNSYNHYFKTHDTVRLYMKNPSSSNQPVLTEMDYYNSKWPILQLRDYQVSSAGSSNKETIEIAFPMQLGDPFTNYILYAYNISMGKNNLSVMKSDVQLSEATKDHKVLSGYTQKVTFKNINVENGKLLSNYMLLKLSNNRNSYDHYRNGDFNNVFPLHMKDILGDDDLADGDFRVYVYSSINAPIMRKNKKAYLANIGIAKDKDNVTFFTFNSQTVKDRNVNDSVDKKYQKLFNLLPTGTFQYQMYIDEFEYQAGESLGFLSALPFRCINDGQAEYLLQRFLVEKGTASYKALAYVKAGEGNMTDAFFADFDAFCITNQEYRDLLKEVIRPSNSSDYEANFPTYLENYYNCLAFNNSSLSETFTDNAANTTVFRYQPVYIDFAGTFLKLVPKPDEVQITRKNSLTKKVLCTNSNITYYYLSVFGLPVNTQNTLENLKWDSLQINMVFNTMRVY